MYRVLVDHGDREETESSAKDGKRAAHAGERNADLGTMCWSGSVFPLICCVGAQHGHMGVALCPSVLALRLRCSVAGEYRRRWRLALCNCSVRGCSFLRGVSGYSLYIPLRFFHIKKSQFSVNERDLNLYALVPSICT